MIGVGLMVLALWAVWIFTREYFLAMSINWSQVTTVITWMVSRRLSATSGGWADRGKY